MEADRRVGCGPAGAGLGRSGRGTSTADANREYPQTIVNTGSSFAVRDCPKPTGTTTSGNQKSHWAISPAAYTVRPAGSGGRYAGRSSATRPDKVRIPNGQPTRSAITVAGIDGSKRSNSRIRGSNSSTLEPAGFRTYFGGPSQANAAFTVFREQPITRAISEIDTPSDFRSRRISAQSSTISTRFLPASTPARVSEKLVKIGLPHRDQFSPAVDTPHHCLGSIC